MMKSDPQALKDALEVITETYTNFAAECIKAGACGIFFATTDWASFNMLNEEQWNEWARPYDLRVLQAVQGAPFNVLHVCKNNNMLFALADYPVHAVNWAVGSQGNPSLRDVQINTSKTVIGGCDERDTGRKAAPARIMSEARRRARATGGRRWIWGLPALSPLIARRKTFAPPAPPPTGFRHLCKIKREGAARPPLLSLIPLIYLGGAHDWRTSRM